MPCPRPRTRSLCPLARACSDGQRTPSGHRGGANTGNAWAFHSWPRFPRSAGRRFSFSRRAARLNICGTRIRKDSNFRKTSASQAVPAFDRSLCRLWPAPATSCQSMHWRRRVFGLRRVPRHHRFEVFVCTTLFTQNVQSDLRQRLGAESETSSGRLVDHFLHRRTGEGPNEMNRLALSGL